MRLDEAGNCFFQDELSGATVASGTAIGTTSWSLLTPVLNYGTTTITITAHDVANRMSIVTLDLVYANTSEVGTSSSSRSCGIGSGLASLLFLAFLSLLRFRPVVISRP